MIEWRWESDGVEVESDEVEVGSDEVEVESDEVKGESDEVGVESDGVEVESDGLEVEKYVPTGNMVGWGTYVHTPIINEHKAQDESSTSP